MFTERKTFWAIGLAAICIALLLITRMPAHPSTRPRPVVLKLSAEQMKGQHRSPVGQPKPLVEEKVKNAQAVGSATESEPKFVRTALPRIGARARHRPWVQASYGPGEDQLGFGHLGGGGEVFPPQGFDVTPDGKLLVLDSNKMRLVRYDQGGRIEKTLPLSGLAMPADVTVTADGTIVVVDHAGVQTQGLQLLDTNGRLKAKWPQIQSGMMTGLYSVGNDVYFANDLVTEKAGDSSGHANSDITGIYENDDDDVVAGFIAPDGRTVVSAGIDDFEGGKFFVEAVRGETPELLFTRHYQAPTRLQLLPYVQSDDQGRIYVVLVEEALTVLLCVDGKTGDPVGSAELPASHGTDYGTPFRQYAVVASGGLVYQQLTDQGATYGWFNCH